MIDDQINELRQRKEQREKKRLDLAKKDLPQRDLFENVIENFRAGTFKFERNCNYTTDTQKLKKDIEQAYDMKNKSMMYAYKPE